MTSLQVFTVNGLQENTYIIDDGSGICAIIDPGCESERERNAVDKYIADNGLKPTIVLLTHLHLDHIYGVKYFTTRYGIEARAGTDDVPMLQLNNQMAALWGIDAPEPFDIGKPIADGEEIAVGSLTLKALHVPGHSPGSIVYYSQADGLCLSGDVLFRLSIGRADLPGGNEKQLIDGIKAKLLTLPDDTAVFPGHGASTTIADERQYNIFLRR